MEHRGVLDDAGVGGVYAIHIRVDAAFVGADGGGHRDCRGVGAAAAERRHVAARIDSLESSDDRGHSVFEIFA